MTDQNTDMQDGDEFEDYSAEELLEQAQINSQALFMGTASTLAGDDIALTTWRTQLAATFIRGWDTDMEWEASDILYALLTSYRSYGAEIVEADFEADPPMVVITNLPNPFLAEALEVDPTLMEHLFRIGEELANQLGGALLWKNLPDGEVELKVSVV